MTFEMRKKYLKKPKNIPKQEHTLFNDLRRKTIRRTKMTLLFFYSFRNR